MISSGYWTYDNRKLRTQENEVAGVIKRNQSPAEKVKIKAHLFAHIPLEVDSTETLENIKQMALNALTEDHLDFQIEIPARSYP